jgi:hypothetical protein
MAIVYGRSKYPETIYKNPDSKKVQSCLEKARQLDDQRLKIIRAKRIVERTLLKNHIPSERLDSFQVHSGSSIEVTYYQTESKTEKTTKTFEIADKADAVAIKAYKDVSK